jgi:hypothetical protein
MTVLSRPVLGQVTDQCGSINGSLAAGTSLCTTQNTSTAKSPDKWKKDPSTWPDPYAPQPGKPNKP